MIFILKQTFFVKVILSESNEYLVPKSLQMIYLLNICIEVYHARTVVLT